LTDRIVATLTDRPTPRTQSAPSKETALGPGAARRRSARRRRRRLLVPPATVALGVALVALAMSIGGGETPPATGAAKLVPANALVYVHLSTDRSRPAVRRALALVGRLPGWPLLSAALTNRIGVPLDAHWLGREAALALLDTSGSSAGSLLVLDVRNRREANAYVAGASADGTYDRVPLFRERSGAVLAFARHYLLSGQAASVRAALDVASGRAPSLAASSAYQQAAAGEPADRVLDAYASVGGVRRVLEPRRGLLGALGLLLDKPALSGVAISASAVSGGLRIQIHEALYPAIARVTTPARQFTPTLASALPSGSTLLLDVHGLARAAPRILAAVATAGVAGRVGPLLARLGSALAAEGVNIPQILGIFSGETAVAITPAGSGRGTGRTPALVIVSRTAHPQGTSALLAGLEAPLAQLFPPPSSGAGQAPELGDIQVAGVTVHQLALAPGFQLDFAVFRGLVVVSTSVQAIAGVARHAATLADTSGYQTTLADSPARVTSLLYFDFNQLLSLAEQAGLMRGPAMLALRPDLERIRAVGLTSTSGESDTTSELFLKFS
jgi:Protein of unknown function (DUF3352)